jgi:outer membrane protein OmpA-like peptidoglycan-associated protein
VLTASAERRAANVARSGARAAAAPGPMSLAAMAARRDARSVLALQRAAGNRSTVAALARLSALTSPPSRRVTAKDVGLTDLEITSPTQRRLLRCTPGRKHVGRQAPTPDCAEANSCPAGTTVGFAFCFDSDEMRPGEEARLRTWASANKDVIAVEVHGYASVDGPDAYNLSLSCHRANVAADVLASGGIKAPVIERYKHGETAEFGGRFEDNRAVYVIPWYRCECVEELTLRGSGGIRGTFGISDYWPVTRYWGADKTLGEFDEPGTDDWRMFGHKFQVIGRFSVGRSATRVAGATFQQMARLTTTKGGTSGAWFDDMNYTDAGGGVHSWDPNAEAGTNGVGGAPGVRRTIATNQYAYTDPPAIGYQESSFPWVGSAAGSNSYRKLEFDIHFRSSPSCPCGKRELTVKATQEIEVEDGDPNVLQRP